MICKRCDNETGITTPLELWAGFVGLEQNRGNFALTPKIGWMIRKKDVENTGLKHKLKSDSKTTGWGGGIAIRVKDFPTEILSIEETESIEIEFLDKIIIPDEFVNVKVENLTLSGEIEDTGIERIIMMFPDSRITINGKLVNGEPKKSWW